MLPTCLNICKTHLSHTCHACRLRYYVENPSSTNREVADVKKKWQDLQSITKKKEASRIKMIHQTGGGPPPEDCSKPWERAIISTFTKTQLEGIVDGEDTCMQMDITDTCTFASSLQGLPFDSCETDSTGRIPCNLVQNINDCDTISVTDLVTDQGVTGSTSYIIVSSPVAQAPACDTAKDKTNKKKAILSFLLLLKDINRTTENAEDKYFELEEKKMKEKQKYRENKLALLKEMVSLQQRTTLAVEKLTDLFVKRSQESEN